ncbi:MAG: sirohydrochlorin cobaltochelatase [Desulfonatronovibrionaceae bacterium]
MNSDQQKTGILLAAFGTSVPGADHVYQDIQDRVESAFPGCSIYWAYTSKVVREKLRDRSQEALSPLQALGVMGEHGFCRAAVQSLLIIPGLEHHDLIRVCNHVQGLPKGLERISLGDPLLCHSDDLEQFVLAMLENIPGDRAEDEAVIFMGHGSTHPANIYYAGLQYHFWLYDQKILVGAVEGTPDLDDVLLRLKKMNIKKALLMPLMVVAGDHALNDMAGRQTDSWLSTLRSRGIEARVCMQGLGAFENITFIWLRHLQRAMDALNPGSV